MAAYLPRRALLRWLTAGVACAALPDAASAQQGDPLSILHDLKLPPELMALLPKKELEVARTISALIEIERDADARGLKATPLAFNADVAKPSAQTNIYSVAVPRLVALIDRSDTSDPAIADRAGELLAEINASQHVIAEALKMGPVPSLRSHDYALLKSEYARLFATTEVRPEHQDVADWYLKAMLEFRPRYEALSKETGVPWYFIGVTHAMEASFNFRAHLHNGDFPLTQRTRQVPAGRPLVWLPPSDWESSAKDALKLLGFTGKSDWSLTRTLYRLEAYNGFGYRKVGVPTPYLWCFSNHYERGKFVADGRWNADAQSQQCGAAVMLKQLAHSGVTDVSDDLAA